MNMWILKITNIYICFALIQVNLANVSIFESNVFFQFYNKSNKVSYTSNSFGDDLTSETGCKPSENVAVIVPGWTESCETTWPQEMISHMNIYRGGCIVCMNYSAYSKNPNYFALVVDFYSIVDVLVNKLRQFVQEEFNPDKIFIFGFSFGGQVALEAGRRFGKKVIGRIDVCEPAGPGFDTNLTYAMENPMDSAKFVQCIHTSLDKGTNKRSCHHNWHMGNCGISQIANGPYPMGSHGLCPHFYNSAFENKFEAIERPASCVPTNRAPTHKLDGIAMGYLLNHLSHTNDSVGHDYYANTYRLPPYHIDILK